MKINFDKNIKFSIVLATASLMGLQDSEAARVYCPTYEALVESETHHPHDEFGKPYHYKARTTGAQRIIFEGRFDHPILYENSRMTRAQKSLGSNLLLCTYYVRARSFSFTSQDVGAFKDCEHGNADYFDCH